ncbi:MAG: glycosyltransferase family 9 protein [Thermovirgaceae bacterium]|nr:glycosyltransferase family 9 protein [Thermovirgaceae bacterium]
MKINTLRRIDIWIGRPVCWILTVLFRTKRIFVKKARIEDPKKILIIKLFGVGSLILALPSLRAIKEQYPDASLFFLTFKGNEAVLSLSGAVSEANIITVRQDSFGHLVMDILHCLRRLVAERMDVVIDMEFFSRFTAILSFFTRSRYRIGFYGFHTEGLKRGSFINFPIQYNHTIHTARAFFTLLKPLGVSSDRYDPTLPLVPPSDNYQERVDRILAKVNPAADRRSIKKWMLINPNTSDLIELRKWPEINFAQTADTLLAKYANLGIIFVGSPQETAVIDSVTEGMTGEYKDRVFNAAGRTSIQGLMDLFHFADLFLTNDSGPAHLASMTDIPTVVLFGPETPELYAPLGGRALCLYLGLDCQPCVSIFNAKRSFCHDNRCLKEISPERVVGLCITALSIPPETRETADMGVP